MVQSPEESPGPRRCWYRTESHERVAWVRRQNNSLPGENLVTNGGQRGGLGENELLLQNVQPPIPFVPSRFGQVKAAFTDTLCTRDPHFSFKCGAQH